MPTLIPTTTLDAIAELYESGLGYKAISTRLGLTRDSVRDAVKRMAKSQGLSRPQGKPFKDLPTATLDAMMAIINRRCRL